MASIYSARSKNLTITFDSISNKPGVITVSYGDDESSFSPLDAEALCTVAQQLTATGTTIVFASGDNGVNSNQATTGEVCTLSFNPTFPSGCPYILSVGATHNTDPEVPVDGSTSNGFWSGAGFSNYFQAPSYQAADVSAYVDSIGTLNQGKYNPKGRAFPDLAALGLNIRIIYETVATNIGGTSASAPIVAGHIALLNNYRTTHGKGRVGWFHPTLYAHQDTLNDLTTGKTAGCLSPEYYFPAAKGWDPASGLGTPKFQAWLNLP